MMTREQVDEMMRPKPGDEVFRHWWNKGDELRRFMIGFYGDGDHFIMVDAEQSKVYFRNDQLDEIISALQHVRDTMNASDGTPTFQYPAPPAEQEAQR